MAFFEEATAPTARPADATASLADAAAIGDATVNVQPQDRAGTPGQATLFPESLAQRLAAARDARGWSQTEVAARLRLPLHIVQWVEAEEYDRIGQGVYLRGYLANYARLLGVPADVVEEFVRSKAPPPPQLVATGQISHSRYLLERYSGSALYLVLTGVIFVPLVMFAMNMGGSVGSHLTPLDSPAPALVSVGEGAAAPITPSSVLPTAGGQDSSSAAASVASHDAPLMASFAVVPNQTVADAAKPVAVAAAEGQLRLSLADASWVEIVDADGKRLEYSTLPAGTVKEYPADKSLTILLGNASGAKVEVGGHAQDIAPYNRGNVARFKLAADGKTIVAATAEAHNG